MNRRERKRASMTAYRLAAKAAINEVKRSGCAACPESEPCCLEFHHTTQKDHHISHMKIYNVPNTAEILYRHKQQGKEASLRALGYDI